MRYQVCQQWRERAGQADECLHYPGDVIEPVDLDQVDRLVACGALRPVDGVAAEVPVETPEPDPAPAPEPEPAEDSVPVEVPKRPADAENAAAWEAYADAIGCDISKCTGKGAVRRDKIRATVKAFEGTK